ncbi:Transcriptional regulatory protein DevR (DosR) [Collinsella aerofaciens]|uniref:Transcriptional regulatory protein DevR (DosR) n=2 Tax=Collinsella aerofaciens TaxID=74426 RepID=A0A5K1JJQ8_9ACTN|nr:Transcriptional regulatory protein DevR (DosR) [Collinsella aerofaciens]
MIRVMVVDDQASARMGLSMMVGRDPELSVIATADDGGAALAELARREGAGEPLPDVVVSDVRMPGAGGVALAREVASRFPPVRTLLLTTYDRDDYALGGLAAGAAGFLLKDATARELCRAVRALAAGGAVLTPRVTREVVARAVPGAAEDPERARLLEALSSLSPRELETASFVAEGLSNKEVAARMVMEPASARRNVSRVLAKLGLRDRTQLAVAWWRSGMGPRESHEG